MRIDKVLSAMDLNNVQYLETRSSKKHKTYISRPTNQRQHDQLSNIIIVIDPFILELKVSRYFGDVPIRTAA